MELMPTNPDESGKYLPATKQIFNSQNSFEVQRACTQRSNRLVEAAAACRLEQLSGEVYQVAQALILCGLPYQPTVKTKITRKATLADGTRVAVTFSTALEGSMPYGSDRSLLHFLLDKAVKTKSRFVSWQKASEFLTAMKMASGGKNRRDLRLRFTRIRGLTIGVERSGPRCNGTEIMPVIRRSNLPTALDQRRGLHALPLSDDIVYGIELDEVFFAELMHRHVPVPKELICATHKQSQLQDLTLFLYWRCYAAQSESVIPWTYLLQQLWQDDTNQQRIKTRFAAAIRVLRCMWPELRAEAQRKGLWVAPPRNGVYLTPRAGATRRLGSYEPLRP